MQHAIIDELDYDNIRLHNSVIHIMYLLLSLTKSLKIPPAIASRTNFLASSS